MADLVVSQLLHNNFMYATAAGGSCMLLPALLMQRVDDRRMIRIANA